MWPSLPKPDITIPFAHIHLDYRIIIDNAPGILSCAFSADNKTLLLTSYNTYIPAIYEQHDDGSWRYAERFVSQMGKGDCWPYYGSMNFGGPIQRTIFSPDEKFIASQDSRHIRVWNKIAGSTSWQCIAELTYGYGSRDPHGIAFSFDNQLLASAAGAYFNIARYDNNAWIQYKRELIPFLVPGRDIVATTCAFSPDNKFLAVGTTDSTVYIFQADQNWECTGRIVYQGERVEYCTFSPDGRFLFVARGNSLHFYYCGNTWNDPPHYNWAAPNLPSPFMRHAPGSRITFCAVSPDNKFIASVSSDAIILWYISPLKEIAYVQTLRHEDAVEIKSCAFSTDGRWLASGAMYDKTMKLWDLSVLSKPLSVAKDKDGYNIVQPIVAPPAIAVGASAASDTFSFRSPYHARRLSTSHGEHLFIPPQTEPRTMSHVFIPSQATCKCGSGTFCTVHLKY